MKKIKKLLVAVLAAVTVVTGVTGCSKQDSIVAVIDGVKVPESLYKTYLWSTSQFFEQLAGPTIWEMELEGKKSEDIAKERALESVVLSIVTTNKADELGIKLTKEEEKSIKEDAKDFVKSQEQLVRAHGFDEKDIEELLLATELSTRVQEKLGENYIPKEEDIQEYLKQAATYDEQVTARHILIKTIDEQMQQLSTEAQKEKYALAQELLEKVKSGEDIGALAKEYSEDPGSNDKNGEFTFRRGEMLPEFEKAAFEGKDGEVWPELVKTNWGYHIVQTIKHIPADETKMKENYINSEKMKFANAEIEELISNAKVEKTEIYDDVQVVVQNAPEKEQNASPTKEADATKEQNNSEQTKDGTTN
ncbi:MAG: peptidylprolyl isomerase [Cellulosilyticaceae bacterium]